MSPTSNERERIRAGIHRLLNDHAKFSNGALTIVALAQESQVPRNALTQRHTDLKNEFYEQVKARGVTPDVEVQLRAEIAKLKKTIANKNEKLARLEADVPALVRAVHVLALENQDLRAQLTQPHTNVVTFRPRPAEYDGHQR
jgi:septal ring factor EnvC (AmiA/AmiB activator)